MTHHQNFICINKNIELEIKKAIKIKSIAHICLFMAHKKTSPIKLYNKLVRPAEPQTNRKSEKAIQFHYYHYVKVIMEALYVKRNLFG